MHTLHLAWDKIWQILTVGLILGAGLPALFAVGVRGLAVGNGHETEDGTVHRANPVGNVVAAIAFLVVVAAVLLGITVIVASGFNKMVSFEHIYPTLVPKK